MNDDGGRFILFVLAMFLMLFVVESLAQVVGVVIKVGTLCVPSDEGVGGRLGSEAGKFFHRLTLSLTTFSEIVLFI